MISWGATLSSTKRDRLVKVEVGAVAGPVVGAAGEDTAVVGAVAGPAAGAAEAVGAVAVTGAIGAVTAAAGAAAGRFLHEYQDANLPEAGVFNRPRFPETVGNPVIRLHFT